MEREIVVTECRMRFAIEACYACYSYFLSSPLSVCLSQGQIDRSVLSPPSPIIQFLTPTQRSIPSPLPLLPPSSPSPFLPLCPPPPSPQISTKLTEYNTTHNSPRGKAPYTATRHCKNSPAAYRRRCRPDPGGSGGGVCTRCVFRAWRRGLRGRGIPGRRRGRAWRGRWWR